MDTRKTAEAIIINKKGEVLLQKKSLDYPVMPNLGHWTFFGGVVDKKETPKQTIKRELIEELGFEFKDIKLWKVKKMYHHPIIKKNLERYIFVVKLNKLHRLSILEGGGIALFDKSELNSIKLYPAIKENILEYFKNTKQGK